MQLIAWVCLLLSEWIFLLLAAVPPSSRLAFVELLIGCMLNPEGRVTRAIGAICREAHWTTYYKLIERASASVADLAIRLLHLVQSVFPTDVADLIMDDKLVPNTAKTGPGISVKHDHARKANRPTFMNSQCWGTVALVVRVRLGSDLTVPIRSRLVEESGQRGKLWAARQLIDSIRGHVTEARLLIDPWFIRKSLILPMVEQRVRIIGQVRRATVLYLPAEPQPKRWGLKRKYGQRVDAAMRDLLPTQEMALWLFGKMQRVRIRSVIAVARFLKGLPVRAVWCEMHQNDGTWSRPRLILTTETDLTAREVVEIYAQRWGTEPLFQNLKRWWGVTNLWQQSKEMLEFWMEIRCTAYALMQLLALKPSASFPLIEIAPGRKGALITAGLFGQWIRIQFIGLRVRDACDPTSGHFVMPFPGKDQCLQC